MKKHERMHIDEKERDIYTQNSDYRMKKRIMQWFVRLVRLDMAYAANETELPPDSRSIYKTGQTKEMKKR